MSIIYDAAVLFAADGNDRTIWADHRVRLEFGRAPYTTAPVIAQVSRSPRQAQLRRFLRGCEILPFASEHAHEVGLLLAAASTADVVDGHLAVVAAQTGSTVVTSDTADLRHLTGYLRVPVPVRTLIDSSSQ
jgi:predicted nucleic acid-binding protein